MPTQATEIVEEIHVGDIGTILEATIKNINTPVDISSATTKNILLKKPAGTVLTKAGVFTTDGTDGQLQYTTISGDLNEDGVWEIQAHVILPAGNWHSDIKKFSVFPNVN
jgi:hypothetical protein